MHKHTYCPEVRSEVPQKTMICMLEEFCCCSLSLCSSECTNLMNFQTLPIFYTNFLVNHGRTGFDTQITHSQKFQIFSVLHLIFWDTGSTSQHIQTLRVFLLPVCYNKIIPNTSFPSNYVLSCHQRLQT